MAQCNAPAKCLCACRDGILQLESDLASLVQQEGSLRKQLELKEQRLQAVENNIEALKHNIQEHQAELRSELHNHLSAVERQELGDLAPRLKMLQVALSLCQLLAQALSTSVQFVCHQC